LSAGINYDVAQLALQVEEQDVCLKIIALSDMQN
jgi:hypothetical protein